MISILNLKFNVPAKLTGFRIDRKSPVGNPFPMKKAVDRDKVCDQYDAWFYNKLSTNAHSAEFMEYLNTMLDVYRRLGGVTLYCWCAPKRCHGETIKKWLEENK